LLHFLPIYAPLRRRDFHVEAGVLKLVGTDPEKIITHVVELLENKTIYQQMSQSKNPFGDGFAAEKIIESLIEIDAKL